MLLIRVVKSLLLSQQGCKDGVLHENKILISNNLWYQVCCMYSIPLNGHKVTSL